MKQLCGVDTLALAKYPKTALDNFREGLPFGSFQNVDGFGSSIKAAQAMLDLYKSPAYRQQVIWEDNHNHSGNLSLAKKRAKIYNEKIVTAYPNTKHYFSPYTEYMGLSVDFLKETYIELRKILGDDVTIVFNPESASENFLSEEKGFANVAVELHGLKYKKVSKRMIFSFDGYDYADADIENLRTKVAKDAELFLIWGWRNNGKVSKDDPTPRPQRKNYVSDRELRAQVFIAMFPKGKISWDKSLGIYKAYQEFKLNPSNVDQLRGGKPCFLLKKNYQEVEFRKGKKTIFRFNAEGYNAEHKAYIYRSLTLYGYEMAQRSVEMTDIDSHVLNVVALFKKKGDKVAKWYKIGSLNPAYREGSWR